MDTEVFLKKVQPRQGAKALAIFRAGCDRPKHYWSGDSSSLARQALQFDVYAGASIYFSCASFTGVRKRRQSEALYVRSFWTDVDCGPDKPYATPAVAVKALKRFLAETRLPSPMVVDSGRGLHLYWCLDQDVPAAVWQPVADRLKATMVHLGFEADPTRTADSASVLRPVGTTHRKTGKTVAVLRDAPPSTLEAITAALDSAADRLGVPASRPRSGPRAPLTGINAELDVQTEYPPADFKQSVRACAQLARIVASGGDCSYESWRLAVGHARSVLGDTPKGRRAAESLTRNRAATGHSNTDWETRFDTWRSGPPTCEAFRAANPAGCRDCTHTCRAPVWLGTDKALHVETPPVSREQQTVQEWCGVSNADSSLDVEWPYPWARGEVCGPHKFGLVRINKVVRKDAEGSEAEVDEPAPFCATVFYPVARLDGGEDGAGLTIEMWVRQDRNGKPTQTKRFDISNTCIADAKSLQKELAKHEIVPLGPNGASTMQGYLNAWITQLKAHAAPTKQLRHFGWNADDSVLVGDTLYRPNATAAKVTLTGMAKSKAPCMVPKGDPQVWIDLVDKAYNARGQEHFQFCVLMGLAAPMFPLYSEFGGATVFAHSSTTGRGKTTAQRVALSVWGYWRDMQLSDGKATAAYLWEAIGAYNNLPVVFDELTNLPNNIASDLVFSVSSGSRRNRCNSDGSPKDNGSNWSTILLASGNISLIEKLSQHRADASAEMARVFEFVVPDNPHLSVEEANDLFPVLLDNYGWAGHKFAAYLAQNRDEVRNTLFAFRRKVISDNEMKQGERYWAAIMAAGLTACYYANKLGLMKFPLKPMRDWLYTQLHECRERMRMNTSSPTELFGRMLADMAPGILTTVGFGDLRTRFGSAEVLGGGIRGALHGRCIVTSHENPVIERLEVSVSSMREWANKRGVSAAEMHQGLVDEGWALAGKPPLNLGRGTKEYGAQGVVRTLVVFPQRWENSDKQVKHLKLATQMVSTAKAEKDRGRR